MSLVQIKYIAYGHCFYIHKTLDTKIQIVKQERKNP